MHCKKNISFTLIFLFTFLLQAGALAQASFEGLGDLPGGFFESTALGVSADGLVVVGVGNSANGDEAFRWENNVMIGLGDLTGGVFQSRAIGVSADGSVVVGAGVSENGNEAFRWTVSGGMVGLGDLPGGNFSSSANDVSANGSVVVGKGTIFAEFAVRWIGGIIDTLGDLPGGQNSSVAFAVSADGSVVVGLGFSANGIEAFRWVNDVMIPLGDLPGGTFQSRAYGVSADGSVVVGYSTSENGSFEAFRWENNVMIPLGDLPGGQFFSIANSVSADGSVVVGQGNTANNGGEAFIWTASDSMRLLQDILVSKYGLDLNGWVLKTANGISEDGTVIVGIGTNPNGFIEAWRAVIPRGSGSITVISPFAGELWIAGEQDTIKWQSEVVDFVDISYSLNGGTDFNTIVLGYPADSGKYVWDIPNSLLSRKCLIQIDYVDPPFKLSAQSGLFKIKGYELTRIDANDDYELFLPHKDGWMFGNARTNMWPMSWWNQFNYNGGTDPYTDEPYPHQFSSKIDSTFPDWPLWVKTFGTDQCYWSTFFGIYKDVSVEKWKKRRHWNGSCYGFAGSGFLGFNYKDEFINGHPGIPQYDTLSSVFLSAISRAA
ncbi:MAG: hypothetical protein IH852_16800, partial [Bacteroidetes bacterium]|nr:hypothetical protein [Bacteroidota bacterium]